MKLIWVAFLLPSIVVADCDVDSAILQIRPGAHWTMNNHDYTTIQWLDVSSKPTSSEISSAILSCQSNQAKLSSYVVELSTTQASLIGATTNYGASTAIGQLQINTKMVRINELRALLGLQ